MLYNLKVWGVGEDRGLYFRKGVTPSEPSGRGWIPVSAQWGHSKETVQPRSVTYGVHTENAHFPVFLHCIRFHVFCMLTSQNKYPCKWSYHLVNTWTLLQFHKWTCIPKKYTAVLARPARWSILGGPECLGGD